VSPVTASVEFLEIGSTPLQMLVTIVALSVIAGVAVTVAIQLAGRFVDRRWPATQTLSPMEMLWAEAGGHVQRTFKGMDLGLSRDLSRNLAERKLKAGAFLFQEGDPASHFYILTKGKAEAVQGGATLLREYGPGQSFGEVAILERTARTAGIRALTDCVVLELPADDFVASAALSAADEVDFDKVVQGYLAADRERAAAPPAAAPPAAAPPTAAPAADPRATAVVSAPAPPAQPAPPAPPPWQPSHLVPAGGLPGWDNASRTGSPVRTLAARTELMVRERTGGTARVVTEEGWEGWVDGRLLIPRRG
jgi:hypothetical protein